jgi:hemin uptake protein HemP
MTTENQKRPDHLNDTEYPTETTNPDTTDLHHNALVGSAIKVTTSTALFSPGQIVATPGALAIMKTHHCLPLDLLIRHLAGDWGVVPEEDAQANQQALVDGTRILSSYELTDGVTIWVITEADCSVTTFLLPEEY